MWELVGQQHFVYKIINMLQEIFELWNTCKLIPK